MQILCFVLRGFKGGLVEGVLLPPSGDECHGFINHMRVNNIGKLRILKWYIVGWGVDIW